MQAKELGDLPEAQAGREAVEDAAIAVLVPLSSHVSGSPTLRRLLFAFIPLAAQSLDGGGNLGRAIRCPATRRAVAARRRTTVFRTRPR